LIWWRLTYGNNIIGTTAPSIAIIGKVSMSCVDKITTIFIQRHASKGHTGREGKKLPKSWRQDCKRTRMAPAVCRLSAKTGGSKLELRTYPDLTATANVN
jgi:hypothetical protein